MVKSDKGHVPRKGSLENLFFNNPYLCDKDYTFFHSTDNFFITPESIYKRRIYYQLKELDELIDSSNMNNKYWIIISE